MNIQQINLAAKASKSLFRKGAFAFLTLALILITGCPPPPSPPEQRQRRCDAYEIFQRRLDTDPDFRARRAEIDSITAAYIRNVRSKDAAGLRSGRAIIPVVVHILYNTAAQNITDVQIESQIAVLNADFRRTNSDIGDVPTEFESVIGDVRIEFQLAVRDPDCGPTDGITRTETDRTFFRSDLDDAKSSATGGVDPWPADRYLNMWVVPGLQNAAGENLLGYASFPGEPAATDGVVIVFDAFGNIGTAAAPFGLGRTATHEIGHYFDAFHIWGDERPGQDECSRNDQVDDTPNQADENYNCPEFPEISCDNGPNGDMFMNYMDYVDDDCMIMFTAGQTERMAAALYGVRASLLGSDGLIPAPATATADLFSQDTPEDIGDEPNTASERMYRSEDIWVRQQNDGLTDQEHEDPFYRASGDPNYVYVRIRNRGCEDAASAEVKLYWAKASTALSWPVPWDGSVTMPALMGGLIGMQPTGVVAGQEFTILEFEWNPPDPNDYASFGADRAHFCLLARIETSSTSPFGMTFPEGSDLNENVRNNNNIVWKNITIATGTASGARESVTTTGNYGKERMSACFGFAPPEANEESIFLWGRVILDLGSKLYSRWEAGGRKGERIEPLGNNRIEILEMKSNLCNIELNPGEVFSLHLEFIPRTRKPYSEVYQLDLVQYNGDPQPENFVGAMRFLVKDMR